MRPHEVLRSQWHHAVLYVKVGAISDPRRDGLEWRQSGRGVAWRFVNRIDFNIRFNHGISIT